jgi:hypothetical protein
MDEPRKRISPLLERALAEIVGLEAEKVEGDKRGSLAAGLGQQAGEVGMAVREEHNGFAIDQGIGDGHGAHRFRDPWKPVVE